MILSRKRSDRIDRRLCRFGVMLVVCSLLVNMVCVPKAKAVAVVDDVAIGAAATAAYFTSTGIPLTVTAGGASAASAGIVAVAGEYAAATGAAASGEALLGSIAAGTALTAAGAVVLTAAAAAVVGALAYWVYETYLLDREDGVSVPVYDNAPQEIFNGVTISGYKFSYVPSGSYIFDASIGGVKCPSYWRGPGNLISIFNLGATKAVVCLSFMSIGLERPQYETDNKGRIYVTNLAHDTSLSNGGSLYYMDGKFSNAQISLNTANLNSLDLATAFDLSTLFGMPEVHELTVSNVSYEALSEIPSAEQLELDIAASPELELADFPEFAFEKVAAGDWSQPSDVPYSVTSVDPYPEPEPEPSPDPDPEPEPEPSPDPDAPELPSNLGDLGAALTTRFPFSIPWDIARAIKLIAAPAQAPYWEVDFLAPMAHWVGGFSGSTKVVLDFGKPEYEIIGIASRWTSTIGFCLALAAATKRFIWTA